MTCLRGEGALPLNCSLTRGIHFLHNLGASKGHPSSETHARLPLHSGCREGGGGMCGGLSSLDRLAFARTRCPKDPKGASFMQGRGCNEIWLRASPSHPAPRFSLSGPSSAPHPDTAPPPPSPSPGNFPSIPKLEFPAQRKRRLQIKGMQHAGRCHGALQPQPPSPLSPASPAQATMVGVVTSASLVPGRSVRIPGPRLWLLGLAVLWLLTARLHAAPVASSRQELRCICLTITPGIHPKMTTTLEVIAPGPQCPNVQVIAILKNGKEVCLDPVAPLIKKIVQKILDSGKKKSD